MKRNLFSILTLALFLCAPARAVAQTVEAPTLTRGTQAQRPAACDSSRGEVYWQADGASGLYLCVGGEWALAGPQHFTQGTFPARPPASDSNRSTFYFATDADGGTLYMSTGSAWVRVGPGLGEAAPEPRVNAAPRYGAAGEAEDIHAGSATFDGRVVVNGLPASANTPHAALTVNRPEAVAAAKVSALDLRSHTFGDGYLQRVFIPGTSDPVVYMDDAGHQYSRLSLIVSGVFADAGSTSYRILTPSAEPTMFAVWSDVDGPAAQFRSNYYPLTVTRVVDFLEGSTGNHVLSVRNNGALAWGVSTYAAQDTFLYRDGGGSLKTDGSFTAGALLVGGDTVIDSARAGQLSRLTVGANSDTSSRRARVAVSGVSSAAVPYLSLFRAGQSEAVLAYDDGFAVRIAFDPAGDTRAAVAAASRFAFTSEGKLAVNTHLPGAQLHVATQNAATKGMIVRAAASPAQPLFEAQNSAGAAGFSVTKEGAWRSSPFGSKPACDSAARGTYWHTFGAAGVKDTVEVCAKDASDVYAWRTLY